MRRKGIEYALLQEKTPLGKYHVCFAGSVPQDMPEAGAVLHEWKSLSIWVTKGGRWIVRDWLQDLRITSRTVPRHARGAGACAMKLLQKLNDAIRTGDPTFLRQLASVIEADSSVGRNKVDLWLLSYFFDFKSKLQKQQATAREVQGLLNKRLKVSLHLTSIKRKCEVLGITLQRGKRGRPRVTV
jgi:hypothetical protein